MEIGRRQATVVTQVFSKRTYLRRVGIKPNELCVIVVAWFEGTPALVVFIMAVDANSAKAGGRTTSMISALAAVTVRRKRDVRQQRTGFRLGDPRPSSI